MSGSGSCLCGSVNLEYNSEPNFFLLCHCTDCQKATGSPVASIIGIPEDDFIIKGETNSYKCEAGVTRSFCINCGSQIFSTAEGAPQRNNGRMTASKDPGLGIKPKMDVLGNSVLEIS